MSTIIRIFPKVTSGTGGMENHIRQLTEEQRTAGFRIILILNEGEKLNEDDLIIKPESKFYDTKPQFVGFFKFYYFVIVAIFRKKLKADIIHIHGDWSSFMFAPLLQKVTKSTKTYFSFHGKIHSNFSHNRILPFLIKKFCKKIFVTGYESFLSLSPTSKAIFQPSGVKELFYGPRTIRGNEKITIVTVTFLRHQKNVITFLKVVQKFSAFHFQIIGDGPEENNLKKFVTNNEIKNVEFLGNRKAEEIKHLLDNADLFLFTSKEEGTPTAVMEAMACGLPIVTSNAGGTVSIVKDYENGFVIRDFEKTESYIEKITEILNSPQLREDMASNNKEKAKLFSWEKVAANISEYMMGNEKRK